MFETLVSFFKWDQYTVQRGDIIRLVFVGVLIALFLHWLWTRRHLYRFAWSFPGEFGWPILGVLAYARDSLDILYRIEYFFKKFKEPTFIIWLGPQPTVMTADPKLIEAVSLSPDLLNKMDVYKVFKIIFGSGLLSSREPEWQHHRRRINPSFNHNVLLSFLPIFYNAKNNVITALESMANDGKYYGLTELFLKTSMDISFETVMGKPFKASNEVDQTFVTNFEMLIRKSTWKGIMTFIHLGFLYDLNFKYTRGVKKYRQCVFQLLKEKEQQRKEDAKQEQIKHNAADNTTMDIKKKPLIFVDNIYNLYQQGIFSAPELIGESNHMLGASFETTSINMFSTLVLIAMHPVVQSRLYEELLNTFPDKNASYDFDQIFQLPYLDMVIKESMRVFPPIPFIGRQTVRDTTLNGRTYPKGLNISLCIYILHRRTDLWGPNAHKFDPDNFLPDNERNRPKYAYLPFAHGARNCIGWRYALFLVKTMVAHVIRHYRLECDTKYEDMQFDLNVTMKFGREPLLRVYRR